MKFGWLATTATAGALLGCSSHQPAAANAELSGGTQYESTLANGNQPGENPAAEARAYYYEGGSRAPRSMRAAQVDDTPTQVSAGEDRPVSDGVAR